MLFVSESRNTLWSGFQEHSLFFFIKAVLLRRSVQPRTKAYKTVMCRSYTFHLWNSLRVPSPPRSQVSTLDAFSVSTHLSLNSYCYMPMACICMHIYAQGCACHKISMKELLSCLFLFVSQDRVYCIALAVWNSFSRPGWLQTQIDPPAFASCMLGLKACTTASWFRFAFSALSKHFVRILSSPLKWLEFISTSQLHSLPLCGSV